MDLDGEPLALFHIDGEVLHLLIGDAAGDGDVQIDLLGMVKVVENPAAFVRLGFLEGNDRIGPT